MPDRAQLAARFEEHRPHLRAIAYRMLGSLAEADEAVQDAWLRVSRADTEQVENFGGWLTTIVSRLCLNALQARTTRARMPDPIVTAPDTTDAEHEILRADAVGIALQIVLDALPPAERLAFVLHDMFDVPFEEIAGLLDRSATAVRQLASRARRRVKSTAVPDPDRARQREVVDAFFAAAHSGELVRLLAVLHPDVVLRSDGGEQRPSFTFVRHGAAAVARTAFASALLHAVLHPVLVNGAAAALVTVKGRRYALMAFTVAHGRIVAIDALLDPQRLARIDLDG